MWNVRLDEAQARVKIAWRNINNLRYADNTTLMAESEEELKTLLMKVKEESEKAGLKLTFLKRRWWYPFHQLVANRWGNNGTVCYFIFLAFKITADDDWRSNEIKWHILLGRKAMIKLDSILKSRDITLPTKVHLVKAMVFPRKRNAKRQNACLRKPCKQLWKEEKWKAKEKRKDISIKMQSSKE